ncbi:MAG: U32 family peptidase [Clostridia bacterium]|nr:U32 family peptidase [Alphaproteobacteria bacterium]MBQ9792565.1 U32 family peptidase [Clostridia bacterium]MBQ9793283.1 U32 family peptidase [Clostridia bacterium]
MKHELLAPAGNIEAGYAALYYGADAVYLGLTKFSARAGAQNFTYEELDEFTAYAHSLNRKVFVALNTILTSDEVKELPEVFKAIDKAKVDALIIQDLGVFYLAKKLIGHIELHASTQMAVHNAEGAKFLKSLGFKRVVLARELTLKEIEEIAREVKDVDLEVFVHGALCYSYSGQCLFSALEYGKSANRGRCVYPCRSEFDVIDEEGKKERRHLFSMKDMALEELVNKIPALSLKIEGRKKSPLYVATVVNYYRHILDGKKKSVNEANDIKQVFSRPWCKFHFDGKNKDITDENFVGHRGLLIGKVEKANKNRLGFRVNHKIARYDGIQIDVKGEEKPFGFGVKNLFINGKSQFEANKGEFVEIELPLEHPFLKEGADVYLSSSSDVKGRYDYKKPKPKEYQNLIGIDVTIEVYKDKIWAMSEGTSVFVEGAFDKAKDVKKVNEAIEKAFNKTGGTNFKLDSIFIANNEELFVPVSYLNELRRKLLDSIVVEDKEYILPLFEEKCKKEKILEKEKFYLNLKTESVDLNEQSCGDLWFVLPQICRNMQRLKKIVDEVYRKGGRKFIVENYYGFELLKKYKDVEIGAGSFIYVMNEYATLQLKNMGAKWCSVALESSIENKENVERKSAIDIREHVDYVPPLFTSAVCIRKNDCKNCVGGIKRYILKKDGKNYEAISEDCQVKVFKL